MPGRARAGPKCRAVARPTGHGPCGHLYRLWQERARGREGERRGIGRSCRPPPPPPPPGDGRPSEADIPTRALVPAVPTLGKQKGEVVVAAVHHNLSGSDRGEPRGVEPGTASKIPAVDGAAPTVMCDGLFHR